MNWIETLIIVCGLSMDVFASVECQGAMLAKIRTRQLVLVTLLVSDRAGNCFISWKSWSRPPV